MRPVEFTCRGTFALPPEQIAAQILELELWPSFQGYGPLPGIASADFLVRTPDVVGTRIAVRNRDGSSHVEEIVAWDPQRRVELRMGEFSAPLARFAASFDEVWLLEPTGSGTRVVRQMRLHARRAWHWPLLWLISWPLRGAIARHLHELVAATATAG